ncbi:NAD(P)/FAD-dependent oxidoreductase [Sulfuricurvum sp.]|uniref:NAD(P)/FAD-dependent oxidoreductase n=1 Tax=Sulfuricurvum sp. TaxID=2025608 RepID=UPI003C6880D1
MIKNYDILVVGGGPAGATAARFLAQKKYKVLLVQKSLTFEKPCGGGVLLKTFDEFALDKAKIAHQVNTIKFVAPSLFGVDVSLEKEPLAIVNRLEFDTYLRTLAQNEGAEVIEGYFKSYDGLLAYIKTNTSELRIQAKYIIAADGVNSTVRKAVTGTLPKRVLTLYAKVEQPLTAKCEFWFGRDIAQGYYAWSFIHNNGTHIGLACEDESNVHTYFGHFCEKLGLKYIPKARGYYIPLWKDDLYRKDNILFVGDAAGQVSPFTYEGIYYAMRSARYAAEAIADGDLDNYQQLWQKNLKKRFKAMELLQKLLLRWDWIIERVVKLLHNTKVHQAALRFWSGKSTPKSAWQTIRKIIKLLSQKTL